MIPKIIHYCWFGRGKMPKIAKKCIRSWKRLCPDYQIIEWNEENFNIESIVWTKQAYQAKKYAFVADYVRLYVLKNYGGVYLDIDQELIKPVDPFMEHRGFGGFMCPNAITMGVIGFEKEHPVVNRLFDYYKGKSYVVNGEQQLLPNTDWSTDILIENGLVLNNKYQVLPHDFHIFPQTYFCPTSCISTEDCSSKDTVSLHHWAMTWRTKEEIRKMRKAKFRYIVDRIRYFPQRSLRKILGDEMIESIKKRIK